MTAPPLAFIPDILEEHFEELQFLWGQREHALRSPVHTPRAVAQLEERIAGRLQGVLAQGERALPLLEAGLASDDAMAAFAAAFTLLRAGGEANERRVLGALAAAGGDRLDGIRRALCAAPCAHLARPLHAMLGTAPTPVAAAIAETLAVQCGAAPGDGRLAWFLRDDAPAVRAAAWRIVAALGAPVEAKAFAAGVRDEDLEVRRNAVAAAAWSGNPGILALGRRLAEAPAAEHLDALLMLAVLGGPDDLPDVLRVARCAELGPARWQVLGAFGHPAMVDVLLPELAAADPASAAAAGVAFTRLTGHDVESDRRAAAPAPGVGQPDDFEAEFEETVALPDPERAYQHWSQHRARFGQTARLCRGHDVNQPLAPETFAELDMAARREIFLRARFRGTWTGTPVALEAYPQAR